MTYPARRPRHRADVRRRVSSAVLLAALLLAGCGADDDDGMIDGTAALVETTAVQAADPALAAHLAALRTVEVDGQRIAYREAGEPGATTLILLHGVPTSSFLYRDVLDPLAAFGYRVIAIDLLGHGGSAKPADLALYSIEAHAARVFDVADALGVERFVLGLHDIGGFVGWRMLRRDEEGRIAGLVAANTTAALEGVTPLPAVVPIVTGEITSEALWSRLDEPGFARETVRGFLEQGDPERAVDAALVEAYAAPLDDGSRFAYTAFFGEIEALVASEPARREAMAAFDAPSAIVFGERDGFFDPDVIVPDLAAALGTDPVDVVRLPAVGHFLQQDAPNGYVLALNDFLARRFPATP